MQKIKILNIGIDNVSSLELLRSLKQGVLVTPNIDHLVKLQKNYYQESRPLMNTVIIWKINK